MPMPNFVDGAILDAADLNALGDAIDAIQAENYGIWQSYTPTNTNVTVGNGTLTARYCLVGGLCYVLWSLVCGSTTSFGGNVEIGLPVVTASTFALTGWARDFGTRGMSIGGSGNSGATNMLLQFGDGTGNTGVVNGTNPWTIAASDSFRISGAYEV